MSQESSFQFQPPWVEYPGSDPAWGGWRQGTSEAWLREVWLPFWNRLNPEDRQAYLEQWPPPDEEWSLYVTHVWSTKSG